MRRNYISPEFIYQKVNGTFNMTEHSSFFGSKMLYIDSSVSIKNDNLVYYQRSNGEQLDINSESSLPQIVYNAIDDKKINHTLKIDDAQSDDQKNGNAMWILDIKIQNILKDYIFATIKKYRTFEGVKNDMTISNNIDSAIIEYIDENILNRYRFSRVEMFLQSIDLISIGGLKYNNQYDANIESTDTLYTKFSTETDPNYFDIRLRFYQENPANLNAFKYYFNIYFDKL
jgi:hypothetical protein